MKKILLVGSGNIAVTYAQILRDMDQKFEVIGRGQFSANKFQQQVDKVVLLGGLEESFHKLKTDFTHAIIATPIDTLLNNALFLMEKGVKQLLIEKPAAVSMEGIQCIAEAASAYNCNVYIAYNRRFYASVKEAEKRIMHEGGLKSVVFEFTEWSHIIEKNQTSEYKLSNWFMVNSTHLVDLAFYFAGKPHELRSFVQNKLPWHPKGSIFTGAGITEKGILFSYHANWAAPGSWKLELMTNQSRYIFRPLEKLKVQPIGQVNEEEIKINDHLDEKYKPGFFNQVETFLTLNHNDVNKLLSIHEAIKLFEIYEQMINKV